jgi:Zn ribbon nucleic-acid-binding protein
MQARVEFLKVVCVDGATMQVEFVCPHCKQRDTTAVDREQVKEGELVSVVCGYCKRTLEI